jgi:hypothetical protein
LVIRGRNLGFGFGLGVGLAGTFIVGPGRSPRRGGSTGLVILRDSASVSPRGFGLGMFGFRYFFISLP